ncbi:type I-C CRISPR-associated protein Cas5c [Thermopirellula anaerolimosa]
MAAARRHTLEVWGDFACFTRPEMKVERYSYPCPTPSAARGIFEAIYFKPQFRWQVDRIEILSEIAYIGLRRNETKEKISEAAVKKWMRGTAEPEPILADGDPDVTGNTGRGRTQRQTMAVRNPRYRITAHIVPRPGNESQQAAYDAQFVRRASCGKCFYQPAFGCREFVAFFRLVQEGEERTPLCEHTEDLGWMVYDVFDLNRINDRSAPPFITLFRAKIERGVLEVPPFDSADVRKPVSQNA